MRTKGICEWCPNPIKCAGLCSACYAWWHRIKHLSAAKLRSYTERQQRMNARMSRYGRRMNG